MAQLNDLRLDVDEAYAKAVAKVQELESKRVEMSSKLAEKEGKLDEAETAAEEAEVAALLGEDHPDAEEVTAREEALREEVTTLRKRLRIIDAALAHAKEVKANAKQQAEQTVGAIGRELHEEAVLGIASAAKSLKKALDREEAIRKKLIQVLADGGPTRKARVTRFIEPLGENALIKGGGKLSVAGYLANADDANYSVGELAEALEDELREYRRTTTSVAVR